MPIQPTSDDPTAGHDLHGRPRQYDGLRRFVLASDLDGTLIDPRTPDDRKLERFARALSGAGERLALWFNSSRPVRSQRESLGAIKFLPRPAFLIGAMGTEIQEGRSGRMVGDYGREQFGDWPRDEIDAVAVETFGLMPHAAEMQTPFKASYNLPEPLMAAAIEGELQSRGLPVKLVVSSGRDLDLLPPAAGKAAAIKWLCGHTATPQEAVLVSGDSANDLDMYADPFRGIVVANGHAELKKLDGPAVFHATRRCSAGVLEGLRHFGVLPAEAAGAGGEEAEAAVP